MSMLINVIPIVTAVFNVILAHLFRFLIDYSKNSCNNYLPATCKRFVANREILTKLITYIDLY